MKPNCLRPILPVITPPSRPHAGIFPLLAFTLALGSAHGLHAGDVNWTFNGIGYWSTASNWNPSTVPTSADNAIVGGSGTANTYIDFTSTPANAGCVTLSADRTSGNQVLRSASASASLTLYGLNGVLINNASSKQFQFMSSGGTLLTVRLAGSGTIGGTGPILFYAPIADTGGSYGFTKTAANTLTFSSTTASTYSGGTTITAGAINLGANTATLGTGPINLAGGNLICGADRSAVSPIPGAVVVSANSSIYNDGGTANSSRYIIFSGEFSGSAGTLTIRNLSGVNNNTNVVRLTGGCNFSRDVVLGLSGDGASRYCALSLANSASGPQTLSGVLSGPGSVRREIATGTTILSRPNSYSGGTVISAGTLLANNTTGSGLGSGPVTVSGGTLGGNGAISGTITVGASGTLAPGASSIGTLTLGAPPSLGLLAMDIKPTDLTSDKLNLTSGAFAYGGTLALTVTAGTLVGGEVFDLFDFTGTSSGSFTITTTPTLAAGLNWWQGNLAANGNLVLNRAPTAQGISMSARSGVVATLQIIGGKHPPTDADGNTLTVSGVSSPTANGATVTTDGINVTYTALSTFTGTDTFTYTVSDGRGGSSAPATVTVDVTSGGGTPPNVVSPPTYDSGSGTFRVTFAGIPNFTYTIQTATGPAGPWSFLKTAMAGANGLFEVTDAQSPPPPARYYRTVYP